ncbi:hypothetical protein M4914_07805 [Streptomyces somaliensis DSM 40738]|uniref:Secreted protein n=2 Tax=Streptomyces somaliensis TaxID=78355 RepID=A0AA44ICU7_STRE0|nr:hypothetical protein [Streptomyces somaliensis]MCQ0022865.1 hypothetical protein [Streptomyces somaliensis DSM 40738]NKY14034.1 hypothetical protein [Streptomyces somaliensis DSM 40738]
MRTPLPSMSRCPRRITVGIAGTALIGAVLAPPALAGPTPTTTGAAGVATAPVQQPKGAQPYVFSYGYNNHLSLGGGNFTVGGRVYVVVKLNSGATHYGKWVVARLGQHNPGGTFHVETHIPYHCPPGKNGYARGYDAATGTWSPKLPVSVCVRFD